VDMSVHPTKNLSEATVRGETVPREPRARARLPLTIGRTYEQFLELPAVFVVAVGWMVGVALLGSIALGAYWTARTLVGVLAGSI
jgi:hypothetical protein